MMCPPQAVHACHDVFDIAQMQQLIPPKPPDAAHLQMMRDTISTLKQQRIQPITAAKATPSGSQGMTTGT